MFGWLLAMAQAFCATVDLELPTSDGFLGFNAKERKFTADFDGAPLKKVTAKIASATGWKVYIDPAAHHEVSAQFTNRTSGEALRLLFGGLNFALVPQTNGVSKLLVFQNSARDATELVEPTKKAEHGKDWIPNELIVSLSKKSNRDIDALAKSLGAKVVERNDKLRSYRLQFDSADAADNARAELSSASDLRADDNYYLRAPDSSGFQAPTGPPDFNLKPDTKTDGHTIVAVVDTAVQNLPASKTDFLLPAINVAGATDPSILASDVPLHGTSMVETILGAMATVEDGRKLGAVDASVLETNPGQQNVSSVRILPVNVYGNSETTTTYDVTMGVYQAVNNGATIVNLSLGGDGDSPLLDDLIAQARQRGVLFFAAAGNTPTTDPTFPAANPAVYAVTAADQTGNIASYANRGSFIDLIAPGTSFMDFGGLTYRVTGTSPATATVSGAAAMYLSGGHTLEQTQAALQQTFGIQPQQQQSK